ncbi:unnamed protein product [Strongylus vulgaris]|uniref:Uncharacterized protein n=1 Tax=Strongylus vulgaris TaxID=40348 RepID=A0A3P7IFE8_STRVU|nr:unnamed protein product [Strongylus vulgaris]
MASDDENELQPGEVAGVSACWLQPPVCRARGATRRSFFGETWLLRKKKREGKYLRRTIALPLDRELFALFALVREACAHSLATPRAPK